MRYLLIDRILDCKNGQQIKGMKNVAMSEDYLEFHFPKNPVMPGVLLLEAMVQLATWLQCVSTDFAQWFVLETVHKSKFYGFALPGDQVEIVVDLVPETPSEETGQDNRRLVFQAVGTVQGQKKIVAEFSGSTIPLTDIVDRDEQIHLYKLLRREMSL
ncbi:MAG: beta-hydroxyacyl-ACP dehydratase [Nitrospirae bacterium]|nr:beta-hydroxyacyl-ACP dehydratase [Nitrospirota bacterium]